MWKVLDDRDSVWIHRLFKLHILSMWKCVGWPQLDFNRDISFSLFIFFPSVGLQDGVLILVHWVNNVVLCLIEKLIFIVETDFDPGNHL